MVASKIIIVSNRPLVHPGIDSKIICFYSSYYTYMYDRKNGTRSSKDNGKENKFEYKFPIICRFLKQMII